MSEINKIDRFLLEYPEDNSMYKTAIKQFFKVIGENPETYFDDKEKYDYKSDIHTFRRYLKDKAPKTIRGYISVVRNFLIKYEVEIPDNIKMPCRQEKKKEEKRKEIRIPLFGVNLIINLID
jgi:hypothetical protein